MHDSVQPVKVRLTEKNLHTNEKFEKQVLNTDDCFNYLSRKSAEQNSLIKFSNSTQNLWSNINQMGMNNVVSRTLTALVNFEHFEQ